ncbi:hypothetical protein Cni_G28981 [Canna indica]|uniref:CBS domain-containing protein n=1 Tax=Canna indica TaxID=4628 RepID=A0AAQ3L3S7_9LILI|nr:hypothetical protein Cni_G28981 [Canna indica]
MSCPHYPTHPPHPPTTSWAGKKKSKVAEVECFSIGRRVEEPEVYHPRSSLVAAMVQALTHWVSYVWVVDEEDYDFMGIATFADMLRLFRE